MKIDTDIFKSILNDEGKIDDEKMNEIVNKLNEEIQTEVSKTYSKGVDKGKESLQSQLEESKKQIQNDKNDNVSKYEQELAELKKAFTEQSNTALVKEFKNSVSGKISKEIMDNLIATVPADKLTEVDLSLFERAEVKNDDENKLPSNKPVNKEAFSKDDIVKKALNKFYR